MIQPSYFITDFKESQSMKKKNSKGAKFGKNDFAFISLLLYVKKYLKFFLTISVKKSQNPNFRNLENFSCEQWFSR